MMAVALLRVAGPLLTNSNFGSQSEDFPLYFALDVLNSITFSHSFQVSDDLSVIFAPPGHTYNFALPFLAKLELQ